MSSWPLRIDATPEDNRPLIPDTPIDFSVPFRSRESGASRHFGFFPFFAKKPWPVVQEYIRHYSKPGDLVCDPFAGSGVTPVESLVLGRRAIAGDINPVARFITQMTAVSPVNLMQLQEAYDQVRSIAQVAITRLDRMTDNEVVKLLSSLDYPHDLIPTTVRGAGASTVDKLHTPRQLAGLTILRDAINQIEDDLYRDLMKVVLANTVRYTNITYSLPANRSPYRGNANFLRRFSFSPAKSSFHEILVWPTVERAFSAVYNAKEETNQLIGLRYNANNFRLTDLPASRIHEITGEGNVDYCFTDPPYSNGIYFLDLSVLWAAWLGLEITSEARKAELITGGTQHKNREQFEREFAASVASISRALKSDHWFTLVYKHKDLSLWQAIVAACEDNGLRYVNAVGQTMKIRSTRQIENPNINPQGDMYLNFRKMVSHRFESVYGGPSVLNLPTRTNYVEHEIERLIVAYLGADIDTITSGVIQQVLDSRAFQNYRENPTHFTEDIQKILKGPKFTTWQPDEGTVYWLMASTSSLDSSLESTDRVRYVIFDLLRQENKVTEGRVRQYLLTYLSQEHDLEPSSFDIPMLLRSMAREVVPHVWLFDTKKITEYKQLRLLFRPSQADWLRERLDNRLVQSDKSLLRLNPEGFALLGDLLREANSGNTRFDVQYSHLKDILKLILLRLESNFEDVVERVMAVGDWASYGIDLRNLPYDDVVVQIVLRSSERPFRLYQQIAEEVFSDLGDEDVLVQFRLLTLLEWQHAESLARADNKEAILGITLLDR